MAPAAEPEDAASANIVKSKSAKKDASTAPSAEPADDASTATDGVRSSFEEVEDLLNKEVANIAPFAEPADAASI